MGNVDEALKRLDQVPDDQSSAAADARIIAVVCVGHTLSHFYTLVLPPLFPVLRAEFDVSYAALGGLITASAGASGATEVISQVWVAAAGPMEATSMATTAPRIRLRSPWWGGVGELVPRTGAGRRRSSGP